MKESYVVLSFRWNLISVFVLDKSDYHCSRGNGKVSLFQCSNVVGIEVKLTSEQTKIRGVPFFTRQEWYLIQSFFMCPPLPQKKQAKSSSCLFCCFLRGGAPVISLLLSLFLLLSLEVNFKWALSILSYFSLSSSYTQCEISSLRVHLSFWQL